MRNKQTLLFKSQSETKTAFHINSFKSLQKKKKSVRGQEYNTTLNCNVACSFSKRRNSSTSEGQGIDQAATSSFFQHIKTRTQLLCSTFVPCSYQPEFTQAFIQVSFCGLIQRVRTEQQHRDNCPISLSLIPTFKGLHSR